LQIRLRRGILHYETALKTATQLPNDDLAIITLRLTLHASVQADIPPRECFNDDVPFATGRELIVDVDVDPRGYADVYIDDTTALGVDLPGTNNADRLEAAIPREPPRTQIHRVVGRDKFNARPRQNDEKGARINDRTTGPRRLCHPLGLPLFKPAPNTVGFRSPDRIYYSDSCPAGLGGYSDQGFAWRFRIPDDLQFRASNNLLEFLAAVITPWIDIIDGRLSRGDCALSMTDSTTAEGSLLREFSQIRCPPIS